MENKERGPAVENRNFCDAIDQCMTNVLLLVYKHALGKGVYNCHYGHNSKTLSMDIHAVNDAETLPNYSLRPVFFDIFDGYPFVVKEYRLQLCFHVKSCNAGRM